MQHVADAGRSSSHVRFHDDQWHLLLRSSPRTVLDALSRAEQWPRKHLKDTSIRAFPRTFHPIIPLATAA